MATVARPAAAAAITKAARKPMGLKGRSRSEAPAAKAPPKKRNHPLTGNPSMTPNLPRRRRGNYRPPAHSGVGSALRRGGHLDRDPHLDDRAFARPALNRELSAERADALAHGQQAVSRLALRPRRVEPDAVVGDP